MSPLASEGRTSGSVLSPTPVLNLLSSTPVHAYSLRQLTSSYVGPAINVRRSSDNATMDIGFTELGVMDITPLLSFVGAGDGFVTKWYDQISTGDLTSVTTGQQPRIVHAGALEKIPIEGNIGIYTGVVNNSVLRNFFLPTFTWQDSYAVSGFNFAGPGASGAGDDHGSALLRGWTGGTDNGFGIPSVNQLNCSNESGGNGTQYGHTVPGSIVGENNLGTRQPIQFIKFSFGGKTTHQYFLDNETFGPNAGIEVGKRVADTGGGEAQQAWLGWVCEVMIFSVVLSNTDRTTLYNNQKAHYHITTNLLADAMNEITSGAWSLRRVVQAYQGPLITVRRDSDNTTLDISVAATTDLLDTAKLLAFVGSGSGFVTAWYDQRGWWAPNLTQATMAQQPRIVHNGVLETLNGKPVMRFGFNVTDQIGLTGTAPGTFGSYFSGSVFTVVASIFTTFPVGTNSCPIAYGGSSTGGNPPLYQGGSGNVWATGFFGSWANPTVTPNALQLIQGPSPVSGNDGLQSSATSVTVGYAPGVSQSAHCGWIGEVFVTARTVLNTGPTDFDFIIANQKAFWGTP